MKHRTQHSRAPIMSSRLFVAISAALILVIISTPRPDTQESLTPGCPLLCADGRSGGASDRASVAIDAGNVRYPVNKGNFGGKIMKELEVYSMYKNLQHLKKLTPTAWIWTQSGGAGSNYRWDTHEPLEGGYEITWGVFGISGDGAIPSVEEPNVIGVEYWQATDMRHCAFMRKFQDSGKAAVLLVFRDDEGNVIVRDDVHYVRFDFKVDAEVPFASNEEDPWCLLRVSSGGWRPNYKVYLREDMRLDVAAYSTINGNHNSETRLNTSNQFTRGEWHTLEVYYVTGSESGAVAYYLDGVQQDVKTGLDTSSPLHTGTRKIEIGCCSGTTAEGKIYVDAVRAHSAYVGVDPGDPRDFILAVHFDSNALTVDDFLYYAEQAGAFPVVQMALHPPDTDRDHETPQYSADLVEYLNGEADVDFVDKAGQLDFTHDTPSDNWANLRAARGRVEPYNVMSFTMGNEPYWADGWPKDNPSLYAQTCCEHAVKMKEVDDSIAIGVFMYDGPGWDEAVLTANKDILNWVCIQHDYSYEPGVGLPDQVPRLLGIPAARNPDTGEPRLRRHGLAREKLEQYLSHRDDLEWIVTAMDEHGFCVVYPPGTGADLGYAIHRLGHRLETIEQGGPCAADGDWLLINDRKYTYGVIGSDCLTPSYWAYRLFYDHFGAKYLGVATDSPEYEITSYRTGQLLYKAPYISAYASLSENDSVLKIIVINRSQDQTIDVDFTVGNFTTAPSTAHIYKVGGEGKGVFDTNLVVPDNIIIEESVLEINPAEFTYSAEPLSMTAIEIDRHTAPVLSARCMTDGTLELSWTEVPLAQSYVMQWGETREHPFGGTEKYPGGMAVFPAETTKLYVEMDTGDSGYNVLKARFADGTETGLSNVLHVEILDAPSNVNAVFVEPALTITWEAVEGVTGYRISCGTTPENPLEFDVVDAGDSTVQVIYPDVSGTFYLIVVAYNEDGVTGRPSEVIQVVLP